MDTNLNLVRDALLKRNYFQFDGSNGANSLKCLKNATTLESIIIRIEQSFNVTQYDFCYNSGKGKFIKLNGTKDFEYLIRHKKCRECSVQCFKSEYSVIEFVELCKSVFQPISVKFA